MNNLSRHLPVYDNKWSTKFDAQAASLPDMDRSVIFARWRQYGPSNTRFRGTTRVCSPKRHFDRFIRFARLTSVPNTETDRNIDHGTYDTCSKRLRLHLCNADMRPNNLQAVESNVGHLTHGFCVLCPLNHSMGSTLHVNEVWPQIP